MLNTIYLWTRNFYERDPKTNTWELIDRERSYIPESWMETKTSDEELAFWRALDAEVNVTYRTDGTVCFDNISPDNNKHTYEEFRPYGLKHLNNVDTYARLLENIENARQLPTVYLDVHDIDPYEPEMLYTFLEFDEVGDTTAWLNLDDFSIEFFDADDVINRMRPRRDYEIPWTGEEIHPHEA